MPLSTGISSQDTILLHINNLICLFVYLFVYTQPLLICTLSNDGGVCLDLRTLHDAFNIVGDR